MARRTPTRPQHAGLGRALGETLRLFRWAPATAALLGTVGAVSQLGLQRGVGAQLRELVVRPDPAAHPQRLGVMVATTLTGWALDCGLQALWARLAWQAVHHPRARRDPLSLWRKLKGAWTSVGVLVAYSSLMVAALGWPRLLMALGRADRPWAWIAAVLTVGVAAAYLGLRLALAVPAAVALQLGGLAAWRESWRATRGRVLPLVVAMALGPALGLGLSRGLERALGEAAAAFWPLVTLAQEAASSALTALPAMLFALNHPGPRRRL